MKRFILSVALVLAGCLAVGCEDVNNDSDVTDIGVEVLSPDVTEDATVDATSDAMSDVIDTMPDGACLVEGDCQGGRHCFAPGEQNCGICMRPENTCALDSDCVEPADAVCDYAGGQSCVCEVQKTCVTPCNVEGGNQCDPDTQVCDETGHCATRLCDSDASCSAWFRCPVGDAMTVCTRKTCVDSTECGEGGWCVRQFCYGEPGTCEYYAP